MKQSLPRLAAPVGGEAAGGQAERKVHGLVGAVTHWSTPTRRLIRAQAVVTTAVS